MPMNCRSDCSEVRQANRDRSEETERVTKMLQAETRKLAAIMFTDIVGFSRQMGSNEARTLRLLDTHNQIIRKSVTEHHGTVIKTVGDAFLRYY
jgi:class 3 adenylate cyclase